MKKANEEQCNYVGKSEPSTKHCAMLYILGKNLSINGEP